jgi:KipI family sensor histidine kinase inhibitor
VTSVRAVRLFGDSAVVVDTTTVDEAHELARALDAAGGPAIEDVIVGFRSVTVVADPSAIEIASEVGDLRDRVTSLVASPPVSVLRASVSDATARADDPVDIPVAFDGTDLDEVARLADLSSTRVVALLLGADLRVAFVGFAPGFAYLVGLPPELAAVPRRPTPRPVVTGGSVALGGGFAGVYPQTSPGGWHIVGRTDRGLFDPTAPPFSVLRAGDRVRLREATVADGSSGGSRARRSGADRAPLRSEARRRLVVDDPGLLSLVQDGGRVGVAHLGVPRAGAADPFARRMANALVGNDEQAAVIEATAQGPTLRFSAPTYIAAVGTTEVRVDGRPEPGGDVIPVGVDQTITVVPGPGLRCYLAVDGGLDLAPVLGSRSSDVLCGLGSGPLIAGDTIGLGPPTRPRGHLLPDAVPGTAAVLRVMLGPDLFSEAAVERLLATRWAVDGASNRVGVRLEADVSVDGAAAGIDSRGMVTGAIQVPPDGRPILALCDHATVGGYPVIATVVSADIGVLGQLRPGDTVGFDIVELADAVRCRRAREREIRERIVGWYPVRTD